MMDRQVPYRQDDASIGEQQYQPCGTAQVLLGAAQRGHAEGPGVRDLRGGADVQASDQQGDQARQTRSGRWRSFACWWSAWWSSVREGKFAGPM
jgi:hypothetical protein